ncbi:uncharacterized protein KD926_009516 [Aspergillus affinis]|uniref:uncharacterized protein n=1 Tax=Aspergillus affinis TaxID=1070780 RepID=UPI0022FEA059|nr:uncharacterized protein KD926_009516 [Aspergillus affinis]KAI9039373.1 hypothetical protein KD926_009516 [Aspergillus affinis]
MGKLSELTSKVTGGSSHGSHGSHGSSAGGPKEDYVDKGLDSLETKYGHGKINPQDHKTRATNEKITDGARHKFESATGINVPSKISN